MTNPLLTSFTLPPFSSIKTEDIVPAVKSALDECRETVERVVAQAGPFTWDNLCQPLADSDDRLGRIFSPISHLNAVKNSPELRAVYEECLPLLSDHSTWAGQHAGLYQAYRSLRAGEPSTALRVAPNKSVDNAPRHFEPYGLGVADATSVV